MHPSSPDRALQAPTHETIADFLVADIHLALNMLELAKTQGDAELSELSLNHAKATLNAMRYFEGQIGDLEKRQMVHARADELEEAIHLFR